MIKDLPLLLRMLCRPSAINIEVEKRCICVGLASAQESILSIPYRYPAKTSQCCKYISRPYFLWFRFASMTVLYISRIMLPDTFWKGL